MATDVVLAASLAVVLVLTFVFILVIYRRYYVRIPPNRALVVYGRPRYGRARFSVATGGGRFVTPIVETHAWLSLEPLTIHLDLDNVSVDVRSRTSVRARVRAEAVARIGPDPALLERAAENLLGKPNPEIEHIVAGVVEGTLRGVLATASLSSVTTDVEPAAGQVLSLASRDLEKLGLVLVSLRVDEVRPSSPAADLRPRLEDVSTRLDDLEDRLRRIEERLGLSPP